MDIKKQDDFWFAVNNTEIIVMPSSPLETFGTTHLRYHLVTELMDATDRIRIREGTIQSQRPQIITPTFYQNTVLEGFGEQARLFAEWVREHAKDFRVLQYGLKVQKTDLNEHLVTGKIQEVLARVKEEVKSRNDPLTGVIYGVDDPWDVCLFKFWADVIRNSAPHHFNELGRRQLFDDAQGVPRAVRNEIDNAFLLASRDAALIGPLLNKLKQHGLFEEYEDRFFALVRQSAKT